MSANKQTSIIHKNNCYEEGKFYDKTDKKVIDKLKDEAAESSSAYEVKWTLTSKTIMKTEKQRKGLRKM